MSSEEERYVTLALSALLNQVSEKDLSVFLSQEVRCSSKDIASAIGDAKVLIRQSDRWNAFRATTVPMLRQIVAEFLRERQRRFKLTHDNDESLSTQIQSIAKSLNKSEFIVKVLAEFEAQEENQHTLIPGQLFVIEQTQPLNDGTRDAWYGGYSVDDVAKEFKWLFSEYVDVVYPR
jgi:hypothetical protein